MGAAAMPPDPGDRRFTHRHEPRRTPWHIPEGPHARRIATSLILGGWAALVAAFVIAHTLFEIDRLVWGTVVLVMVAAALIALVAGIALAVAVLESPLQHVFRCRPMTMTAVLLVVLGVSALGLAIAQRSIPPTLDGEHLVPVTALADVAMGLGAAVMAIGAMLLMAGAVRACRLERRWADHVHRLG